MLMFLFYLELILFQIIAWINRACAASFPLFSVIPSFQSFTWITNHGVVFAELAGDAYLASHIESHTLLHRGAGPLSYATCSSKHRCIFART
jgi:lipoprotein signal peptidase